MEIKKVQKLSFRAVFLICKNCREVYRIKRSAHLKSTYCSSSCMATDYRERLKSLNNPNFKNAKENLKPCLQCGSDFYNSQAQVKYCSRRCYGDSRMSKARFCKLFYCKKCGVLLKKKSKFCDNHKDGIEYGECRWCKGPLMSMKQGKVFCSVKCKGDSYLGKLNPNYKDGRKELKLRIRQSTKHLHVQAIKRDNYTCGKCGKIGGKLEADHITPFSMIYDDFMRKNVNLSDDDAFIKAKEWPAFNNINNLKTLCRTCNMRKFNKFEVQQIMGLGKDCP